MPPWIIKVIEQISDPFMLFSLIILYFMYKMLIKKNEVIEELLNHHGKGSRVTVIPDGTSCIPEDPIIG